MTSATATRAPLACVRGVSVGYGEGEARVHALRDVSLAISPGSQTALWGRSGSGKTTLLHVLGGLVAPQGGAVEWEGQALSTLDAAARGRAGARGIAYVFQNSNLLPHFTAFENLAFAARVAHDGPERRLEPSALLEVVGLAGKADSLAAELSGGEAQRVAIARALAQRPRMLLADEPTGQLDSDTAERVLDLIGALQRELGFALVLATHDADVAAGLSRRVHLFDGRIIEEEGT